MNLCLHLTDLISWNHNISIILMIHQCTEESAHKRKDNYYNITMHLYWIIAEFLMQ